MADIERLHYFNDQFLKEEDFTDEQEYHLTMRRRHNRLLHTPGIADGLKVRKTGAQEVKVTSGTALDSNGREMILVEDRNLSLASDLRTNSTVYVTITYADQKPEERSKWQPEEERDKEDSQRFTRWIEKPKIEATTEEPDPTVIKLARFELDANGNIPGSIESELNGGVRQEAAAKLPNFSISIEQLKTRVVADDTKSIAAGGELSIPAYSIGISSTKTDRNIGAFLLVYAYSKNEGATFNWRQEYKTERLEGDSEYMLRQYVVFQNTSPTLQPINLDYKIYAVLES